MKFKPCSLAQLFDPPEGCRGVFGWLCGYSADAGFLDDAVERFSGFTRAQRSYQGKILLGVMLDPGNPQILPADVPGVLHVPVKSRDLPFKLLHAKVAVLGFDCSDRHLLRVIVTTGNWTRQTLEESLDLAWHFDVTSNDKGAKELTGQEHTDLASAWSFLSWVRKLFDTRPLDGQNSPNESAAAAEKVASWAQALGKVNRTYRSRFFDNRTRSLLQQLPGLIESHAGLVARNYLALGSGFYESVRLAAPNVPEGIFEQLRKNGLLTASCDKNIFVNPFACQAIATSRPWIEEQGWTIRWARSPGYFGTVPRTLHAKFLFSANNRDGSNNCSSSWVYLGSGNLTNPGFCQKAGSIGNLEAGVVLAPAHLKWQAEQGDEAESVVTALLPIHRDNEENVPLPTLQPGEDMADREVAFVAAPVSMFLWEETSEGSRLVSQGGESGAFHVLDPDRNRCEVATGGGFIWSTSRPRHVTVSWHSDGKDREAEIPVIDVYGRFCATAFPSLDLEQAWTQLANFPMPPDDEELMDGDAQASVDGVTADENILASRTGVYPIRRMMALVEDITAKQADISQSDWSTWCNRLEQVLIQSKDSSDVKAFYAIGMNPLHPLFQPSFRPTFAATDRTAEGALYETALVRIVEAWGLEGQSALGGHP